MATTNFEFYGYNDCVKLQNEHAMAVITPHGSNALAQRIALPLVICETVSESDQTGTVEEVVQLGRPCARTLQMNPLSISVLSRLCRCCHHAMPHAHALVDEENHDA
jgi:hypothetical protein